MGYEICTVGLKFSINVSTLLYYVQYSTGTIGYVLYRTVQYRYWYCTRIVQLYKKQQLAYCGLLSLCCGPELSWEFCPVGYFIV